jgi:hypothetical protein
MHNRDMANIQLPWEVHGIITPEESVQNMIQVIKSKGIQHSGTFWTWENKVHSIKVYIWHWLISSAALSMVTPLFLFLFSSISSRRLF